MKVGEAEGCAKMENGLGGRKMLDRFKVNQDVG